ncbi:MAG: hypothetical protein KIS81_07670 [Maricaulaceae bacterium]|nr:hypothetical protein [Maricaulaceae bacterium]
MDDSFACNVGTGMGVSVREILGHVEAVTGRPAPFDIAPRRPGDAASLVADTRLGRELLGFVPRRSDPGTIITDAWRFHAPRWGVEV